MCWRPQHDAVLLAVGGAVGLAVFEAKPEVRYASAACNESAVLGPQWVLTSDVLMSASGTNHFVASHPQDGAAEGSAAARDWHLRRMCTLAGRLPVCTVAFGGSKAMQTGDASGLAAAHGASSLACACLDGSLFVWDLNDGPLAETPLRLQVTLNNVCNCTAPGCWHFAAQDSSGHL